MALLAMCDHHTAQDDGEHGHPLLGQLDLEADAAPFLSHSLLVEARLWQILQFRHVLPRLERSDDGL